MSETMLKLGPFRFSIQTAAYKELTRRSAFRWVGGERFGRRSAKQFTGPDEETISLSGKILPHFKGGLGQLDKMRELAEAGEALLLVDDRGYIWGDFGIASVNETQRRIDGRGIPYAQDFELSLVRTANDEREGFL